MCFVSDTTAASDIEPASGTIYFTSNQASQDIRIRVKADGIPEIAEVDAANLKDFKFTAPDSQINSCFDYSRMTHYHGQSVL